MPGITQLTKFISSWGLHQKLLWNQYFKIVSFQFKENKSYSTNECQPRHVSWCQTRQWLFLLLCLFVCVSRVCLCLCLDLCISCEGVVIFLSVNRENKLLLKQNRMHKYSWRLSNKLHQWIASTNYL